MIMLAACEMIGQWRTGADNLYIHLLTCVPMMVGSDILWSIDGKFLLLVYVILSLLLGGFLLNIIVYFFISLLKLIYFGN